MKVKIDGTKYTRDLSTMAVLCNDKSEVLKYENELRKHRENVSRDEEINKLKADISEIKQMLQILTRGQNG
jgi:hypothetical protein